jgi:hypothetical protein
VSNPRKRSRRARRDTSTKVQKGGYCVGLVEAADYKRGSAVGTIVFSLKNLEKCQQAVGGVRTRFCSGWPVLCGRARGGQDTSFTELPSLTSHLFSKVRTGKSILGATTEGGLVGHDYIMRIGGLVGAVEWGCRAQSLILYAYTTCLLPYLVIQQNKEV